MAVPVVAAVAEVAEKVEVAAEAEATEATIAEAAQEVGASEAESAFNTEIGADSMTEFPDEVGDTVGNSYNAEAGNEAAESVSEASVEKPITESYIDEALTDGIRSQLSIDGIDNICNLYSKRAEEIMKHVEKLKNAKTKAEKFDAFYGLEQVKGRMFEDMLKIAFRNNFEGEAITQPMLQSTNGIVKADICMKGATRDLQIAGKEIASGQNLWAEVKCGSASYLRQEIPHILEQVSGHPENSMLIVTNDIFDMSIEMQGKLLAGLEANNSNLCVLDISSIEVASSLMEFVETCTIGGV